MDWAAILKVLKIPLKILLPALCLFSGILIFGNEGFLQKMNLLDWSKTNGFIFGLIFLISSCLIVIYLSFFLFKWIKDLYIKMSIKRKCFKTIGNLDWAELEILANLYKKYGYTDIVDSNQPIIQGLISRNLIYFVQHLCMPES